MKKRVFAIVNHNELATADALALAVQMKQITGDKVVVCSKKTGCDLPDGVEFLQIPTNLASRPIEKNFVLKHFKEADEDVWLHVIEDSIELKNDPRQFINDIERMMDIYGLNNWFGTITDGCNYIYSKYNPRLNIVIDSEVHKKLEIANAVFCSHSNVQWTVYNIQQADADELYFDERFTVDMYWIIEFLARRRNAHPGSLYFMNQYYTCASEKGVYAFKKDQPKKQDDSIDLQKRMQQEDALFKSLGVNYAPDNNVDKVLETLYVRLNSRI